jgi:hypothetical protein
LIKRRIEIAIRQDPKPQIVADRQILKQRLLLRHIDDAEPALQMRRHPRDVLSRDPDGSAPGREETQHRLQQ